MSFSAMAWALKVTRDVDLTPGERFILFLLAYHSREDYDHMAWPKQTTLALESGQSDRHVRSCTDKLAQKGLLRVLKGIPDGSWKGLTYHLAVKATFEKSDFGEGTESSGDTESSGNDHRNTLPVIPDDTSGDNRMTLPVTGPLSIYGVNMNLQENLQPEIHAVSKESQIGVRKPKERFKPRYPSRDKERPAPAAASRPKLDQETLAWLAKLAGIFQEVDPSSAKREVGLLQPNAALRALILEDVTNRSKAPNWESDKPRMFFYFREKTWEVPYDLTWHRSPVTGDWYCLTPEQSKAREESAALRQ